jgi:type IV pilus assembly protein PilM
MFGFGKKYFLGVDIGTSSIKIVELELGGNKPVLSNYGWVSLEELIKEKDSLALWKKYISKIIQEGKFKGRDAYVSIPSSGSLITLIEFPGMEREDLDQAIRFEAHKYIPVPLEEVVLSWDVIGSVGTEKTTEIPRQESDKGLINNSQQKEIVPLRKVQVLLVAAPKIKVEKYEELIKEVDLELKSMEIEGFSMTRSLIGNDQGNFIIVDMGARVCNIILAEKGIIKVNRNISSGGLDITRAIAKSLNIEEPRADNLKIKGENLITGESKMTFPSMEVIINEIKRIIEAYYRNNGKNKIDSLIISGGTANLKGIVEYFQNSLGIKTIIGNPLSRIEYPRILDPKLNELKARFSVAVGLALKGVEESLKKK